jgi:MFS family permease
MAPKLSRMMQNQNLWHNRAFVLFWLGRTISLAGTAITSVVLPILIYQLTGSALQTSLLTTFNVLPYLIFGLFAGVVADRVNRKRLMVTPEHLLGRVNVTARMIAWGGAPFGAVIGGTLAEFFDIRIAYAIMAVGVLVSAILGWFSPLREPATIVHSGQVQ